MSKLRCEWQNTRYALSWFGASERSAVRGYRGYVAQGVALGGRAELVGRRWIRSLGGWSRVRALGTSGWRTRADARILGTGEFVDRLVDEATGCIRSRRPSGRRLGPAPGAIAKGCADCEGSVAELRGSSRRGRVSRFRSDLARHLVTQLGLPLAEAARQLGVTTPAISRALQRGRAAMGKST
jgi:hypothetical protein